MSLEMNLPRKLPAMTLSDAVLFPQAIMPLYIFEPRYREMLADVLEGERMFGLATLDDQKARESGQFEPPFSIATVGMIRACHHNDDGTANLVLQGVCRARVDRIVSENPYRTIEVTPLASVAGADADRLLALREQALRHLLNRDQIAGDMPNDFYAFIRKVADPEIFIDLSAYTTCDDTDLKLRLLGELDTAARLRLFCRWLEDRNRRFSLYRQIQGDLADDDIELN